MTAPLWTGRAFAEAIRGRLSGELPDAVAGVSIDSRTVAPGEAFFAIRGDRLDGHAFVGDAFARGASIAVVEDTLAEDLADLGPLLAVPDALDGLVALAGAARTRARARVIAVTGSVGKTGTKDALRLVLARSGPTHGASASHNNHWGVPLTLARLPRDDAFAVFEIGMNHPGEITPLARLVAPHVAVVTTVAPVHLAQFPSVEAIADAKAEIFSGLAPGGTAVLNLDNRHFARLAAAAREAGAAVVSFGFDPAAMVRAERFIPHADGSTVVADILGVPVTYRVGSPGRHQAENSLAVLAATQLVGADIALAAIELGKLKPSPGRGQRFPLTLRSGEALLIDESYNANPVSMRAALELLAGAPVAERGRRIAVLGDMLELGPQGESLHRGLADPVSAAKVDLVFAAGPLMRALVEALPRNVRARWAETAADLQPLVLDEVRGGDVVMVKGSNGSRMGALAAALKARYEHIADPA